VLLREGEDRDAFAHALAQQLASLLPDETAATAGVIRVGALCIELDAHRVSVSGEPLRLTRIEHKLLVALASPPGRINDREGLVAAVWGLRGVKATTNAVDTHVKRLRIKLRAAGCVIETVRGAGYRLHGSALPPAAHRNK
jgi:two-component system phosphate regulon response regulator PhoB